MNKKQKGRQTKRQHTCAVAVKIGSVLVNPYNAKPDAESTIGPVTRFCGDRVCPAHLTTTPKVAEHRTLRRVARPVLPKPRPIEADDNATATTSPQNTAKVITTSEAVKTTPNANGNKVPGIVVSAKTGARASVGVAYDARFQAYIDDLANNPRTRLLFIHG